MSYVCYHRHDSYSNVLLADSTSVIQEFADRCKELGHEILSSCNHGGSYNWLETQMVAEANGLRFRYVVEAYFVKDRKEPDRTNAHLILAAKTKKGIGDLNEAISEANLTGYYHRPRIDLEILLGLDPADVFVTTACVGGVFKYGFEEATSLILTMHQHFRDSFMLEVQYHNTDKQREVNEFILCLYRKHNIPIIMGTDSHVIYPHQEELRELRLEANDIRYELEEGWNYDYPDEETCIERFREQGVLSEAQIREAIDNTNIFLTFEDVPSNKAKKIPTIYPDKTQAERNEIYKQLVLDGYVAMYGNAVTAEQAEADMKELEYEMSAITDTDTSDYFITLKKIVDEAKARGGILTPTGRGSMVSFATNHMLGLTSVNRLRIPLTLYPDRFVSKDRLASGSLPDADLNTSNQGAFAEAGKAVLGEWGCVPLIAYGKLGALSAWKMYARAEKVPFEDSNAVSDMIKQYELALKYAKEDEDDDEDEFDDDGEVGDDFDRPEKENKIKLSDYVSAKYLPMVEASASYQGIVNSVAPHPCAFVLLDRDIRREIGVMRLKAKGGNGYIYAAMVDGATADRCGYVKSDFLAVDVVALNAGAYDEAGIPLPTANELVEMTKADRQTWEMYAKGYTVGLNQCEQAKTTSNIKRFKPRNIVELSAFVAAIRPSFQSMIEVFLTRQKFSFGIPVLDNLLRTPEMASSFLVYQEQIFSILIAAGISAPEAYTVIKAISKKKLDTIHSYKEQFLRGFVEVIASDGRTKPHEAHDAAERVWQIVEDASAYGFAGSHAYCVALDSLYSAYVKAHYPHEFYVSALRVYGKKKKKKKLAALKTEMRQAFGITVAPPRFGQDSRSFYVDKEANTISDALPGVKYMSAQVAEVLCSMRDREYDYFVDLLVDLENETGIDSRQTGILIDLGYFSAFGNEGKLKEVYAEFSEGKFRYKKTHKDKTKKERIEALRMIEDMTTGDPMSIPDKMRFETEYLGAPVSVVPDAKNLYTVIELDTKYSPKVQLFNVASGTTGQMKIRKAVFNLKPFKVGDSIAIKEWNKRPAYAYINGKSVKKKDEYEFWIDIYSIAS